MEKKTMTFIQGKKKREELLLPILHYVAMDDWLEKMGSNAFTSWLKFITFCDRSDDDRENDLIPYSLERVAKKLGMTKPTLYKTVIHPLWEFGFIDLIEFEDSTRKSQKPMNVIVYAYPQNNKDLETKPLQKCRDWKTDYSSAAKTFAEMRGTKKVEKIEDIVAEKPKLRYKMHRKENLTVYRKKNLTVHRKENLTVTVKKILRNNVLNSSINVLNNSITNVTNIDDEEEEKNNNTIVDKKSFEKLSKHLQEQYDFDNRMLNSIHSEMVEKELNFITTKEADIKIRQIVEYGLEKVVDYAVYFVGGIIKNRTSDERALNAEKIAKAKQQAAEQKEQAERNRPIVPFRNWLEDRDEPVRELVAVGSNLSDYKSMGKKLVISEDDLPF